jgi:hypothetical protein
MFSIIKKNMCQKNTRLNMHMILKYRHVKRYVRVISLYHVYTASVHKWSGKKSITEQEHADSAHM